MTFDNVSIFDRATNLVGSLALLAGLALGGLEGAAWGISASMLPYFAYYFLTLAHWKNIPDESLA